MTFVALLCALALAVVGALFGLMWWAQERLLFGPTVLPADYRFKVPTDVQEGWIEVPGARLNFLHLRLPHPAGVVFFLHGNAGSLDTWFVDPELYRKINFDLYMIDYRGFGKSTGHIQNQAQLDADVRTAWNEVAPKYAGLRRVIYGRSLGTGLAATLAAQVQPELTVLVSPYDSMVTLAHEQYPWAPRAVLERLLRYPLHTDRALVAVKGPVLLAHGGRDELISVSHTQRLHRFAPQARVLIVPEAGHGDIHEFPAYLDGLAQAIAGQ
jgi:pimeloyl-ACP methyl ester carboxylesterase